MNVRGLRIFLFSYANYMTIPFVNFGEQYRQHKEEYDEAYFRCANNGKLVLQEDVEEFEKNLAKFLGMKYAIGVNSGTDAIMLALKAKDLPFPTFITTSGYTFKATAEAIHHAGCNVFFEDIGEDRLFKEAGIVVHIEGMVARSEYAIIEDACQAIGAEGVGYSGIACFSFYPAKILGCFGDGGAVVTDDKQIADKVRLYRHHWQTDDNEEYAYNSRLDNLQAAFLNIRLKYLPEILKRREEVAKRYLTLEGVVDLPIYQKGRVWQDYVIRVRDPKALAKFLEDNGIETLGVGLMPPHKALKGNEDLELPNTEILYKEMLRLPCNETLSNEDVDYVIEKVKEFFKG